jgi:hypothetical protein
MNPEEVSKSIVKRRNLTTLRKNVRETKQKPGRKKPRLGDVDVKPAPDSKVGKANKALSPIAHSSSIDIDLTTPLNMTELNDTELDRDVKYSKTLWLAKSPVFPTDLGVNDRQLITSDTGWLNDIIIDFCQSHLKEQYTYIDGLFSVLEAGSMKYPRSTVPMIQIINTDVVGQSSHWITLSTLGTHDGTLEVYDSAGGSHLKLEAIKAICHVVNPTDVEYLTIHFMECDHQMNGNDCGVYAIANAVALCHDISPTDIRYNHLYMRTHLLNCMEAKKFTPFPSEPTGDVLLSSQRRHGCWIEKLFCSCNMPEDDQMYFMCKMCKKWFHPHCEGLGHKNKEWIRKHPNLKCTVCQSKKAPKARKRR